MKPEKFTYVPDGKIINEFFWNRDPVSIIQGPIGCLSGDTEFLSPDGWVRMDQWAGHKVLAWYDGHAEFEIPHGYVAAPCDEMWKLSSRHALSMVMSDEHIVPLYDRDGKFRVRRADEVAAAPGRYSVPIHFNRCGVRYVPDLLRLHVAICADGCLPERGNQVIITVRKERKKIRLRQLLTKMGLAWVEREHKTRPTELTFAFNREIWMTKKLALWDADSASCEIIVDELRHWDGLHDSGYDRFDTTDCESAEFVQMAAHASGRRATIGRKTDERNADWAPLFSVHIAKTGSPKNSVGIRADSIEVERVKTEKKYCFTTSTGFFVARHDGRIFVTGNSGTSTACCFKMFRIATEQKPDKFGTRRTRWLIVRNTYSELKETTLKTWKFWFEEIAQGRFGEVKMSNPPNHHIKTDLPDGTSLDAEFIFLSLDQEEDVRKLVSLEVTGIWFNEAQFTDKSIFNTAHSRAMQGRYPPKLVGGPTWKGVICDLNAPPEGHWIPYMRGDIPLPDDWDDEDRKQYDKPDNWSFFIQPSGLIEVIRDRRIVGYEENPEAENMKWVDESYLELIKGKPKSWIDTYVMNRVGLYRAGKPVFETFRRDVHVSKEPIEYHKEWPLIVGLDFARNPAAVICQMIRGVLYVLDEFGIENTTTGVFAPLLKQRIQRKFPEAFKTGIQFWGDPSGVKRSGESDLTAFKVFQANGMNAVAAPGNNVLSLRIEAVQSQLDKMVGGSAGLVIAPGCIYLKNGMDGGYHFAKLKGQNRYHEVPMKDRYSDYCDALQYAALGAGLGFAAMNPGGKKPKPHKVERKRYSLRRSR